MTYKPMGIIFLGPPGSGKGTQSQALQERCSFVPLSTGDVLRQAVKHKTDLGLAVEKIMHEGSLVPDDIMNSLIAERLSQDDCKEKGYILDGYPRTLAQAQALDAIIKNSGLALNHVFLFLVDAQVVLDRIDRRAALADPGQARTDDNRAVSEKRLRIYYDQIKSIAEYYEQFNVLTKIDAADEPERVTSDIMRTIEGK